jgi:hypothetical protein
VLEISGFHAVESGPRTREGGRASVAEQARGAVVGRDRAAGDSTGAFLPGKPPARRKMA